MTTISAGAAAGLLVALMVMSTSDGYSAEPAEMEQADGLVHPGHIRSFNPQPDPPRELGNGSIRIGDGSVKPAGR